MLSVKLVRSLVLGETIINNPCYHHHNNNDNNDDNAHKHTHDEYDADDDHDDNDSHVLRTQIQPKNNPKSSSKTHQKTKKKMPLLLFTPTKELISDTFRLATIARDIGMDFYPSPTLSHLYFSWPSQPAWPGEGKMHATLPARLSVSGSEEGKMYETTRLYSPISPLSTMSSNNRPSVSSTTTTCSSSTSTTSTSMIPNDAVPLPFPALSFSSSISLLRYFVSLSKGLFKLVFVEIDANSRFNYYGNCNYGGNLRNGFDSEKGVKLISRVSGKVVDSMEEFSRVLAGNGWALFRSPERKKTEGLVLEFMFRKQDFNRVRVRGEKMMDGGGGGGGGVGRGCSGGECRVRELRLPTLDFKGGVPLRILQYILLMTDDVFYLA